MTDNKLMPENSAGIEDSDAGRQGAQHFSHPASCDEVRGNQHGRKEEQSKQ